MITDGIKDASKGTFHTAIITVVGAVLIYFVIKAYEHWA